MQVGEQEPTVVATLAEGNYFGEISLLKLEDGCNRRNADVRSVGYSELLVLSKRDLNQVNRSSEKSCARSLCSRFRWNTYVRTVHNLKKLLNEEGITRIMFGFRP